MFVCWWGTLPHKTAALEVEISVFIAGLAMFQLYLRALGICDALNNLGKLRAELKKCGKLAVIETGLSEGRRGRSSTLRLAGLWSEETRLSSSSCAICNPLVIDVAAWPFLIIRMGRHCV
jgi:hypothetical protein